MEEKYEPNPYIVGVLAFALILAETCFSSYLLFKYALEVPITSMTWFIGIHAFRSFIYFCKNLPKKGSK